MTPRHNLKAADWTFRDLMRSILPFGGKSFLSIEDVRYILPVVRDGNQPRIFNGYLKQSTLYPLFEKLQI